MDKLVDELVGTLRKADNALGQGHFKEIDVLLKEYCARTHSNVFPFDETELGLVYTGYKVM